ncbi:hypothetical protein BGZ59_011636 [Podila verticillata]|nr:hypothetical protein BGZ59_011636 [Podila verticillata]
MQCQQNPSIQDRQQTASPVNIDLIVDDKENIQPIREGRSAQTLSHLFATQLNDRVQELEQQHQQFQHDIEHSEDDDDPLDIYVRYIQWIVENYPQGAGQGHDSNLLPVLEQAMKAFKGDERYRNDPRYVRFYVQYSGIVEDPDHIFKFMMANNIGVQLAMLYEEYAEYLEDTEDYVSAREILTLGINRHAMPLGRLKKSRNEFELRAQKFEEEAERQAMQEALLHGDARQAGSGQGLAAQRKVLGIKVSRSESKPTNISSHFHVALNSASAISRSQSQQGATSIQRPNGKLTIYSDATDSISSSTGASVGHASPSQGANRQTIEEPWKDLSTEQIRRKENVYESTPWQGVTLRSDVTVPKKATFDIYMAGPQQERAEAPITESPQHISMTYTVENTQRSARAPLPSQLRDIARISSRFPVALSEERKPERLMFDQKEIYAEGEEYSIEEIRARRYCSISSTTAGLIRGPEFNPMATSPPGTPLQMDGNNDFDSMPCTPPQETFSEDENNPLYQQYPAERMLVVSEEQMERRKRIAEHRRKLRESPTIHTVEADAYMNRMFSSDYRAKKRKADSDVERTPTYLSEEARAILEDPVLQYDSDDDHDRSFDDEDCGTMTLAIREMRRNDSLDRSRSAGVALPVDLTIAIAERRRIEADKDKA